MPSAHACQLPGICVSHSFHWGVHMLDCTFLLVLQYCARNLAAPQRTRSTSGAALRTRQSTCIRRTFSRQPSAACKQTMHLLLAWRSHHRLDHGRGAGTCGPQTASTSFLRYVHGPTCGNDGIMNPQPDTTISRSLASKLPPTVRFFALGGALPQCVRSV